MSVLEDQPKLRFLTGSMMIHKPQGSWMLHPGSKALDGSGHLLWYMQIYFCGGFVLISFFSWFHCPQFPKVLIYKASVWPVAISRDGFWFSHSSCNIIWKSRFLTFLNVYHILSSWAEKLWNITHVPRNVGDEMTRLSRKLVLHWPISSWYIA